LEIWEIAVQLGVNDPPTEESIAQRPNADGPIPFNVRRMMAEAKARDEGRTFTDADMPAESTVVDLIRRGSKGGFG